MDVRVEVIRDEGVVVDVAAAGFPLDFTAAPMAFVLAGADLLIEYQPTIANVSDSSSQEMARQIDDSIAPSFGWTL